MKTIFFFKTLDLFISFTICIGFASIGEYIYLYMFLGVYHMVSVAINGFYTVTGTGSYNKQRRWYFMCVVGYFFAAFIVSRFGLSDVLMAALAIPPAILGLWYICICFFEVYELWQIIYKGKTKKINTEDKTGKQKPEDLFI